MKDLIAGLRQVGEEMSAERGELSLLGLFQREELMGDWDVVVAAPWIGAERTAELPYVVRKLQARLKHPELTSIARVVPLNPSVPFVKTIHELAGNVEGLKEVPGFTFDGMALTRGYVLISHPDGYSTLRKEAATSQPT